MCDCTSARSLFESGCRGHQGAGRPSESSASFALPSQARRTFALLALDTQSSELYSRIFRAREDFLPLQSHLKQLSRIGHTRLARWLASSFPPLQQLLVVVNYSAGCLARFVVLHCWSPAPHGQQQSSALATVTLPPPTDTPTLTLPLTSSPRRVSVLGDLMSYSELTLLYQQASTLPSGPS